jgi:hypothetical protein
MFFIVKALLNYQNISQKGRSVKCFDSSRGLCNNILKDLHFKKHNYSRSKYCNLHLFTPAIVFYTNRFHTPCRLSGGVCAGRPCFFNECAGLFVVGDIYNLDLSSVARLQHVIPGAGSCGQEHD